MAVFLEDTFTRTSASTWGTSDSGTVWIPQGTGAVFSTAGTYGKITGSVNVVTHAEALIGTHTAIEIVGRVLLSVINSGSLAGFCVRFTDTNNYYHSRISGAGNLSISKKVAGTSTDIVTYAFTPLAATWYWIRFRVYGSTLQSKYWINGNAEPSGWRLQTTDAILSSGTYITCRHNMTLGTSYTQWEDIVAVDYYEGNYNNETFDDNGGDNTSEYTDFTSLTMDDSGVLIPEKMDTASIGDFTTLQSESCERRVTDLAPLVDVGSVVQTIAAVTESIGLNYEVLQDTLSTSGERKDVSVAFAFQSQMRSTENTYILSSPLTDVPAKSTFHTDTTLEAFIDNTPTKVGTSAQLAEVLPLSDSMTHEIDIYKNLTEVLAERLIPPLRETETVEMYLLIEGGGIHLLYYTDNDSQILVAIAPASINDINESIVLSQNPLDATERVSGDNTNAPATLLLVDTLQGTGSYQLPDSLAMGENIALSKETQQTQTMLNSVIIAMQKNFLENLIIFPLDDVIHLISVQSSDNSLSISDINVTSSEKIFYESNPLNETNSRIEESISTTSAAFTVSVQNTGVYQGATVGTNLFDTLSYRTSNVTDSAIVLLVDMEVQPQRETAALVAAVVQDILYLLGQDTSIYTALLDSTGNAIRDTPDALKRDVVWKTPAMQVAWSTPLTTLVVRTPAMQAVWKTPTMVVEWELVD